MKSSFKPKLSLAITLAQPELDPKLKARVMAAVRNVQVTADGWLRTDKDWRRIYANWLKWLFPQAWVYTGGHHLAVHASPPPQPGKGRHEEGGEAGTLLFAIIETKLT